MSEDSGPKLKVLVVCLGNICRSPMVAEQVDTMLGKSQMRGVLRIYGMESAQITSNVGCRTVETCKRHKVPIDSIARQIRTSDFINFTHILAADENNLETLLRVKPSNATAGVRLWGSYLDGKSIPDPYYGGIGGFEGVFQQCIRLSNAFLDEVLK